MKSRKQQNAEWIAEFSNHLFWDVDKSKIDLSKSAHFMVGRVFSHGLLSDWFLLKKIYGKELIRQVALEQRHLDKHSLAFCIAYFDEPITNFRCYNYALSNPTHWDY